MGNDMAALERLTEWVESERGRSVEIYKPSGYGVHDGEVKLWNVDKHPKEGWVETDFNEIIKHACVLGIDQTNVMNPEYTNAENFVMSGEDDLELLINKCIDKAIELGL